MTKIKFSVGRKSFQNTRKKFKKYFKNKIRNKKSEKRNDLKCRRGCRSLRPLVSRPHHVGWKPSQKLKMVSGPAIENWPEKHIFEQKMPFFVGEMGFLRSFWNSDNNLMFSCRFTAVRKFQKLLPSKFTHDIATTNPTQITLG